VLVVRWAVPAVQGLKQLVQFGDVGRFLFSEIDRLETPLSQPEGWEYPWHVGPGEVYTAVPRLSQRPAIGCYTHEEATNLQKDVVLPFTPETRLRWSWKMDQLPSQIREDDYRHTITSASRSSSIMSKISRTTGAQNCRQTPRIGVRFRNGARGRPM